MTLLPHLCPQLSLSPSDNGLTKAVNTQQPRIALSAITQENHSPVQRKDYIAQIFLLQKKARWLGQILLAHLRHSPPHSGRYSFHTRKIGAKGDKGIGIGNGTASAKATSTQSEEIKEGENIIFLVSCPPLYSTQVATATATYVKGKQARKKAELMPTFSRPLPLLSLLYSLVTLLGMDVNMCRQRFLYRIRLHFLQRLNPVPVGHPISLFHKNELVM